MTEQALEAIERLPTIDALDIVPTEEDVTSAMESLTNGKSPGNDGISPEVLKCGKRTLLPHLHHCSELCWKEESVPQDLRDANIITIYKEPS